jgi:hypothetical protein
VILSTDIANDDGNGNFPSPTFLANKPDLKLRCVYGLLFKHQCGVREIASGYRIEPGRT